MAISTDIDKDEISRYIGYSADSKPPSRILSLIDDYAENAYHLVEPAYSCVIRNVERVRKSRVLVGGSLVFESDVIARLLGECERVAVFLVTIGNHLEETACRLLEDRLIVQATVLDAVGSVAADKVAEFVQDKVSAIAQNQGLCTSRRFSPGYCDWNISQQKMVFRALDNHSMGVRLTDGYQMFPRKSVSGIIGIGPCDSNIEHYNPCKTCKKHNCSGRR